MIKHRQAATRSRRHGDGFGARGAKVGGMFDAIIWDMDGTLVDSEPLWGEATYAMSEHLGKRFTVEQRATTVGTNFDFTFELAARNGGHDPATLDRNYWRDFLYTRVIALMREKLVLRAGVRELLTELHTEGVPMAIATNTERLVAQAPFEVIGEQLFATTVCGDEVETPKPAPDMYLKAAEVIGVDPSKCLVFEDSAAGMRGAVAAGCRVIGLPESPTLKLPDGVYPMRKLHGGVEFTGVSAQKLRDWYEVISA